MIRPLTQRTYSCGTLEKSKYNQSKIITMKNIFILFLFILAFDSTAQISTAWTSTISSRKLPTGATVPTVAAIDDSNRETFALNLDGTTIDNATETTAWTALGAATKVAIDSNWIEEVWGLNPALDITGRIVITDVLRRFDNFEPKDWPNQYTAATNVFRVTGYFEWIIE